MHRLDAIIKRDYNHLWTNHVFEYLTGYRKTFSDQLHKIVSKFVQEFALKLTDFDKENTTVRSALHHNERSKSLHLRYKVTDAYDHSPLGSCTHPLPYFQGIQSSPSCHKYRKQRPRTCALAIKEANDLFEDDSTQALSFNWVKGSIVND